MNDKEAVKNSPSSMLNAYVQKEEMEEFCHFFKESCLYNKKHFKLCDSKTEAAKYSDLEHAINNYRMINKGKHFYENKPAQILFKLVYWKYRSIYANHKFDLGCCRRSYIEHSCKWQDFRFFAKKIKSFKTNILEDRILAKHIKSLVEAKVLSPAKSPGPRGVAAFFLTPKPAVDEKDESKNMGTKLLRQEYERNKVLKNSSVIIEGEAIEKERDGTLDDIVSKSDFTPQNTKDHMKKLKQEMSTFSTKSNNYDWKNKSKSSLIQSEEEAKFNSRLENFFEQEEIQNAWFKEEETQDNDAEKAPQISLIGKTGEELREVVERKDRKELEVPCLFHKSNKQSAEDCIRDERHCLVHSKARKEPWVNKDRPCNKCPIKK